MPCCPHAAEADDTLEELLPWNRNAHVDLTMQPYPVFHSLLTLMILVTWVAVWNFFFAQRISELVSTTACTLSRIYALMKSIVMGVGWFDMICSNFDTFAVCCSTRLESNCSSVACIVCRVYMCCIHVERTVSLKLSCVYVCVCVTMGRVISND